MKNIIDFDKKPVRIVPYNFGEVVTRENFIHFLVLSYAISGGSFTNQKVFFMMMEHKVGFPYETVIENFYNHGSFDAFSQEEQDIFMTAFRSVPQHMKKYEEFEIDDEVRQELKGLYDRPKNDGKIALGAALEFFDFDQINSIADFTKTASEFNKKWEDSLN